MLRSTTFLIVLALALGASEASAQARKPAAPVKAPTVKDASISVNVFMIDGGKNELLVATRIWPDYPDYNAVALQRFFALMKALGPAYRQDDNVAYTWSNKARVTKCSIYLEAFEAGAKGGTGALVGCEANGVSNVPATSVADPQRPPSPSASPQHLSDVLDLLKRQSERARNSLPKQ